jgi:hypothetical protein
VPLVESHHPLPGLNSSSLYRRVRVLRAVLEGVIVIVARGQLYIRDRAFPLAPGMVRV